MTGVVLQRALVAWSDKRQSARALRDALLLPARARQVDPVRFTPEALLSRAAEVQADFIVMGGYGHARPWEFVLGGFTCTMLASMTVPVLMSH